MPDLYCKACKKTTLHKSIMKRCPVDDQSSSGVLCNAQQWVSRLVGGSHYYDLERQHFCRTCNCRSESESQVLLSS